MTGSLAQGENVHDLQVALFPSSTMWIIGMMPGEYCPALVQSIGLGG